MVGKDLENIDLEFRLEMNEEGHRFFSDFGTADLFFEISACVKASDGAEVVPLCLGLNMDKTHMSRLSDINAWPCNGLIMNLKTSVLSTRKGSRLLGYYPILNMSDRSLAPFLLEADRRKQGKGRYALYATSNRVYDCYEAAMQGKCLASKCNSPLNLVHSITRGVAVANSKYIFDTKQKLAKLKSGNSVIPANTEIMYSYGRTYKTCDYLVFASNDYI